MFRMHRLSGVVFLNSTLSPKQCHPSFSIFLNFFSVLTDARKLFTISYLTNICALSSEIARKVSKHVSFATADKPDSVITFFKTHGFSTSHIHNIISKAPELLACDPIKRVLPKFQFLASKGASPSNIVLMVSKSPTFLRNSLENFVIPTFELVRTFSPSDVKALGYIVAFPSAIGDPRVACNVKLLLDAGLTPLNIHHLLRTRISILCSSDLSEVVEELKGLGFDPSSLKFSIALLAKKVVRKSQWDAKVDFFKRWGWSEDDVLNAFRKHPNFMLRSVDKLDAVMSFWVNHLGWDGSVLLRSPALFGYKLEERIIPRALVVQYLISKGLIKKDTSLTTPFNMSDQMFLQRFVKPFARKGDSRLFLVYRGKR